VFVRGVWKPGLSFSGAVQSPVVLSPSTGWSLVSRHGCSDFGRPIACANSA
jgi:hypothetical protein